MKISLSPETARRIRETLGEDVDLAPEAVPGVLARLAVEAPAVYSQVLAELSGSQIKLDSEEELRRRRRRGVLRRLLFSWGEYETGAGDRLLAKRHIAAVIPLSLAALTLTLLTLALVWGHRTGPTPSQRAAAIPRPREVLRSEAGIPSVIVPRSRPFAQDDMAGPNGFSSARPLRQPPLAGMLPVPALSPGLLSLADPAALSGRPLGSPVVVSLQANPAREGSRGEPGAGGPPPVVYNRASEVDPAQREPADRPATSPSLKSTAPAADARPSAGTQHPFVPGMRIPATLVTGVVAVPGGRAVPVVVETASPHGVWMGQAVLGPGDRVQVMVTLANQGRGDEARGIALDPDRFLPGLPGRTTMQHSSTSAAMAAATLQAASDYAQAAARQGSIGVFEGWGPIVLGGQVPEAWTYLAARLAQEFQAKGTQGGWVSTTEIPAGTQIVILITGAT